MSTPTDPRKSPPADPKEPYGSIIERFRGTQWDPALGQPAPPPPPPGAPIGRSLIVIGVAALLVAAALAAFGGLSPRPVAEEPSRFIATPQPTPGPDDILLAAFWTTIEAPDLSFHVQSSGTATAGAEKGSLSTTLDVRGEDFSGTFTSRIKGDPFTGIWSIVRSEGVVYLRQGTKGWQSTAANQIELRMAPFLGLVDHRQLRYDAAITEGGSTLYRLVSTDLYRPGIGRVLPIVQVVVADATYRLELIVTAQGVPARATLVAHGDANPAIRAPAIDVTASYTFTRFGEIGPISPPKL